MMENQEFVFISYSSIDAHTAHEVYAYLTGKRINCWMAPQSMRAGQDYPSQIVEAIRNCSAFVLLASNNTNQSPHVSNEVATAFDAGKPLIAVRIEDFQFTDEYIYYLKRKHWIDAFSDLYEGLAQLHSTLSGFLHQEEAESVTEAPRARSFYESRPAEPAARPAVKERKKITDRNEIASVLENLSAKYSYSLFERIKDKKNYDSFVKNAEILFRNTMSLEYRGTTITDFESYVDFTVENLCSNNSVVINVHGLPGSAKNMLMQLAFFKIMENFVNGTLNVLPIYVSVGYYERHTYRHGREQEELEALIREDLQPFVDYVCENKEIVPVVLVEGVREYATTKYTVEATVARVLEPIGKFNRMVSRDTGLIKNRQRLKKFFPLGGEVRVGYLFRTEPIEIENKEKLLKVIECVLEMYDYNLDAHKIYNTLVKFKYSSVDIYLIRFIAKDAYSVSDNSIADIYEGMALNEYGDEERLFEASEYLFDYVFADRAVGVYRGELGKKVWSLPNKHHTCLEFLLAYYFTQCIERYQTLDDYSFFKMMLTSTANQFIVAMLKDNYELQERFYEFINSKYEIFDARQKSNAAYWLGRINYNKNLKNQALTFLTSQFAKLKTLVKTNNKATQENMDNHFVFRAVCTAMLFHGQANMMDEHLCVVITNDIANAINRGVAVEYFGNDYQMCAFNEYYLDTDPTRGESALKRLNTRIEKSLYGHDGKFVENNLVTLLTLLQARIQTKGGPGYDISFYVKKALEYLKAYKFKPQNIASGKILYYFDGVKDDLENYLANGAFDIGPMLYNRCKFMKSVKRSQWVSRGIDDPESVSEHVISSWLLAMLFLPEESRYDGYNKKEILDMLLIHDMAQTVQGEKCDSGTPVTKKLEFQDENVIMRKFFLKGTYPDVANLTYFYNIWTGFYNGININAKIAQDINLIQSIYTFCEYYSENKDNFTEDDVQDWMASRSKIITEIGYEIYDRMILNNSAFSEIIKKFK